MATTHLLPDGSHFAAPTRLRSFIRVAWPSGYQPCLFCLPCAYNPKGPSSSSSTATSKVTPLLPPTGPASPRRPLLVKGQESSRRLLTSARDRLGDSMPLPADTEQVGASDG